MTARDHPGHAEARGTPGVVRLIVRVRHDEHGFSRLHGLGQRANTALMDDRQRVWKQEIVRCVLDRNGVGRRLR